MPKSSNQKMKLFYLAQILLKHTDENHPMTVSQMISNLNSYGISAERKSIYDDLNLLRDYGGMDIISVKQKNVGYFVASRDFELAELKLLVDSVQNSKFITGKKSLELISKIEKLGSVHDAKALQREVFVANRVKSMNESIYYNVDAIHEAIAKNKVITFKYFEWTFQKEKKYKKDGGLYRETPIALTWSNENYYLITYKPKYENYAHYRVDKMEKITLTDEDRAKPKQKFDIVEYSKKVFSMYGGTDDVVTVEFDNSLAGVVIDRFGSGVFMRKIDENTFSAKLNVSVSHQFLSWILGFGAKAKIVAPTEVVDKMREYIRQIDKLYS